MCRSAADRKTQTYGDHRVGPAQATYGSNMGEQRGKHSLGDSNPVTGSGTNDFTH